MKVSEAIHDLPVTANGGASPLAVDPTLTGITQDSRLVREGDLFVALVGQRFDGRIFVQEALDRGAAAVLASGPAPAGFAGVWLSTPDPRRALGPLSARIYGHPDRELLLAGITGTNGKSTISELLAAILEAAGRPTGTVGTLGCRFREDVYPTVHTTPEASDFFSILRRMRDAGAEAVAAEVSSHALAMGRVEGARFDLALFTNLTRDHFDFHRDFEDYFAAKRHLFELLSEEGRAVVNIDDPYGRRLAAGLERVTTYGREGEIRAVESELDEQGIRGVIETPRGELPFSSPLLGSYNLENLLGAVAAAEALELPHGAVAQGIAARGPLPGRMEPVNGRAAGQASFPILIDYAHTDAALEAVLRSVRSFSDARILLVFGCGGDRDPGKRPLMGRVAGELAERVIVTSDNPRLEDPLAIIAAVEEGLRMSGHKNYKVLPDRRDAIRRAVEEAGAGWLVLIAGKGHEQIQIVGDREVPFSDRLEVEKALEARFGAGTFG